MIVKLDKSQPSYQQDLADLRRIAADLGGHPRGVFYFKTFEEFNEFKEIFHKKPQSELPNTDRHSIDE